jgi:hypothetical protein
MMSLLDLKQMSAEGGMKRDIHNSSNFCKNADKKVTKVMTDQLD